MGAAKDQKTTSQKKPASRQATKKATKKVTTPKNQPKPKASELAANQEPEVFAKGLSIPKLFFIFMIGSVLGTIYEDILIYYLTWKETGVGEWIIHRGVIYGPFNIIYGFGAAVMCWVLLRKKYKSWQIFTISALLGGVIEYVLSYLQELITHTTSWDYSHQFLNINGRTTIPLMLVWGLMGLLLVKFVYPFLSNLIEKIPPRIGKPLFWVLLIFMIFDCLISWTAVIRQTLRHNDIAPFTPIGEFYDSYYTDEFLKRYYTNMERK